MSVQDLKVLRLMVNSETPDLKDLVDGFNLAIDEMYDLRAKLKEKTRELEEARRDQDRAIKAGMKLRARMKELEKSVGLADKLAASLVEAKPRIDDLEKTYFRLLRLLGDIRSTESGFEHLEDGLQDRVFVELERQI